MNRTDIDTEHFSMDENDAAADRWQEEQEAWLEATQAEQETEEQRIEREDYFEKASNASEAEYLEYLKMCAEEESYEQDFGE